MADERASTPSLPALDDVVDDEASRPSGPVTDQPALARVLELVGAPVSIPSVERSAVDAAPVSPVVEPVRSMPGLRTARVTSVSGRLAEVLFRGSVRPTPAALAAEVETEIVELACRHRDLVLIEVGDDGVPVVCGVLQTRRPRDVHLKADTITLEASREILLKTGRAGLRLREDGDVELVGSRILAFSRGLFRAVGKMLRLN